MEDSQQVFDDLKFADFQSLFRDFHHQVFHLGKVNERAFDYFWKMRDYIRVGKIIEFPCIASSYSDAMWTVANEVLNSSREYADKKAMKNCQTELSKYVAEAYRNAPPASEAVKRDEYFQRMGGGEVRLEMSVWNRIAEEYRDDVRRREEWLIDLVDWADELVSEKPFSQLDHKAIDSYFDRILAGMEGELSSARRNVNTIASPLQGVAATAGDDRERQPESNNGKILVTIHDIAYIVDLQPNSMSPYTSEWGKPERPSTGKRRAEYSLQSILKILIKQFPGDKSSFEELMIPGRLEKVRKSIEVGKAVQNGRVKGTKR